jgi:Rad3-related DNA helicase
MHPVLDYLTHVLPQRPGFHHNPVQVAYAQALIDGLKQQGKVHFVEGDTGIGKSLAYQLVLADWVAKGKHMGGKQAARRVVISTHSRALQRQLLQPENLTIVQDYLDHVGLPRLTFQLRMGRENYLSPERLMLQLGAISLEAAAEDRHRPDTHRRLARWALESDGCLLDLDPAWLPDGWQLSDIALRRDDPLPEALENQLHAALDSDILVINHALLVVDLVTQGRVTQAASPYVLLLDEAEHYPELAEELLSQRVSLQAAARLLKQLKQHRVAGQWETLLATLTNTDRAGSAHGISEAESESLQEAIQALLALRPRESAHDPVLWREWQHLRHSAEKIATRLRETNRYLVLDYSPVRGLPGLVAHAPSAASSLRNGGGERITFLTSATLSDLDHVPGEVPQFRYMRSRLQLPATSRRSGLQASFQARQFGELRFRLPRGLPHPIAHLSGGGYRLSRAYCRAVLPFLIDQPGRTLVLCASYADVEALVEAWPDETRDRLVAHHAGMGLSELVARLEADAILVTPAGWEGLSPAREGDNAYWSHLVVLRNPRPARSAVEQRLVEQLLQRRGHGQERAALMASGMLYRKSTVRTLHKLRQGLGRAIRHPEDRVLVTLLEPRFPRPSGVTPLAGVRQSDALLWAIPARFRPAWQQAEETLRQDDADTTAASAPDTSLPALL